MVFSKTEANSRIRFSDLNLENIGMSSSLRVVVEHLFQKIVGEIVGKVAPYEQLIVRLLKISIGHVLFHAGSVD